MKLVCYYKNIYPNFPGCYWCNLENRYMLLIFWLNSVFDHVFDKLVIVQFVYLLKF